MTPTAAEVREVLNYDPDTGIFTWRVPRGWVPAGSIAGSINSHGYRNFRIGGRMLKAHRIAWLLCYGEWPLFDLDHKDCNKDNNAIDNLRRATRSQNGGNRPATKRNRSGLKGVKFHANGWTATIGFNHRRIYLGRFSTPEEAHRAYVAAAVKLFGQFARAA